MKVTTQDWLNYAETDLIACEKMLDDVFLTNIVAFHTQQTVEKCFKAILEEKDQKVPRIHNLMRLYDEISGLINFPIDEDMLEMVDEIYIETRYPGVLGMLPNGKPSLKHAGKLYDFAKYIFWETKKMLE